MNLRAMALTRTAFLRRVRSSITAITTKIRSPPQHLANSTPTLNYYKLLDHNANRDQEREIGDGIMSAREVRKVLRASEMEQARARLRAVPKALIDYSEFLEICCDVSAVDGGLEIARRLDRSGDVIVLGNVVYLRADQLAIEVARLMIPILKDDNEENNSSKLEELKEMEEKKAEIDQEAEALVRRELWCGLGFLAAQTIGFARLTFWELSWDVMEPICYFTTSAYFTAGYCFFLRTSTEPSFQGFFASRLAAKQKRLMEAYQFDVRRFDELKRDFALRPTASRSCYGCHESTGSCVGNLR